MLSPIVGIVTYIIFHTNIGNKELKKSLNQAEYETRKYSPSLEETDALLSKRENLDIKGLGDYLATKGGVSPHTDTKVKYFCCGEDFLPDFCEALKSAKKFIFLEFFIIDVDESWTKILEILEQKVEEGVEVRLLYDGFGSLTIATNKYQKYLASKGIISHIFMPLIPFFSVHLNNRDHRKIVVIDGEVAYTGGLNLTNEYFNVGKNRFPYWQDNGIRVEGPAILNYTQLFLQNWNMETKVEDDYEKYLSLPYEHYEKDGIVIPYGDNIYNGVDIAEDVYLYIINNAKKYLYITTPYMIIDKTVENALIFAANRGVDVKIIVPSVPDHKITFCVGKTYLKTLVENGVKIYLYTRGFIHEKTFVSDDKLATVGSVNLDYRSLYHHFETNTLFYKNSIIPEIKKDLTRLMKDDCSEMKVGDYKKIPSKDRFLGRVFRVIAPLL